MDKNNKNFFWPSYVDLLTALFAVVLVLFVLSFKLFKDREEESKKEKNKLEVYARQYERIEKIDKQIKALEDMGFKYDTIYKRFLVKDFIGEEIFERLDSKIKPKFFEAAYNAGMRIKDLIDTLYKNERVRFLVLIEGNTAKKYDGSTNPEDKSGYQLSYNRALALKTFWIEKGIVFDPQKCELLVAGSGFSGVGRDEDENNNKRFLIQIIPKIEK